MSNFKIATKDDVKNAGFVFVKDVNTQEVKKIATSADFQVGLSNVPRNLIVTGDLTSPATTFNLLNEPTTRTTNIATGAAVQTVTLGSSNSSSALTLDAGSGGINIGTNPGGSIKTINVGTTSAINTDVNIGSEYLASKTIIKAGGPFATLGGLYLSGSTVTTYTIGGETGTGATTLGRSTDTNTISIGNANTASAKTQTINIGAGTGFLSGKSLVTVGSTANASALTLQAGTGYIKASTRVGVNLSRAPSSMLDIKQSSDPTYSSTTITNNGSAIRIEDGDGDAWIIGAGDNSNLWFGWTTNASSATSTAQGFLNSAENDFTLMNFTGQHRCIPESRNIDDYSNKIGLIVIAIGQYQNPLSGSTIGAYNRNIAINDATPIIELASQRNDKRSFGVVSELEDVSDGAREFAVGKFVSVTESGGAEDNRLFINAIGEGAIWVCNINGNLENGDYITTCEIPGYGMKQEDDIMRNYTVAKITCDCSFDLNSSMYECEEFYNNGIKFIRAFVGCTYHCG